MSWVVSLVGCGGPAVSRCGHETRRHRVRGALFASVFASVLLAACGGGSGGNLTTSSEPELRPPGPGPLTATGGGDGQGSESENEQQQQKSIVNQEEEIVVNIQSDPEESESEEQEEESEEEEEESEEEQEQQQQLTIIEEEDFPYVPPEEKEYETSPQTGGGNSLAIVNGRREPKAIENCGNVNTNTVVNCAPVAGQSSSISGTNYTVDYTVKNNWYSSSFVNLQGKDRDLEANLIGRTNNAAFNPSDANYNFAYKNIDLKKKIEVTYTKGSGFHGFYSYKGRSGQITEDVILKATFNNKEKIALPYIEGYIGDNNGITMNGTNFGQIKFSATKIGGIGDNTLEDGQFIDKEVRFSNGNISSDIGFRELRGSFKNDGSTTSFPTQVVGELEMKRFFDQSPLASNNYSEYDKNLSKRGDNALAGVFVADNTNEEETYLAPIGFDTTGSIGMFEYGIWASTRPEDSRAELSIPKGQEVLYPKTPIRVVDLGGGLGTQELRDAIDVTYKKEDGFRGAYVYKDQIGTITSDVHLIATYNSDVYGSNHNVSFKGFIAKPFTMAGDSFQGIVVRGLSVIASSGEIDFIGNNNLFFGSIIFNPGGSVSAPTSQTVQDEGNMQLNVGFTKGNSEGSVSLDKYPNHVGGELKITGFSLDETKSYADNSLVGVFVGDKKSARNENLNIEIE